jgi:hypothetical protein
MAFPMTSAGLLMMVNQSCVPTNVIIDVTVHQIANDIFKSAVEGKTHYTCHVQTKDVLPIMERLLKMFPDCSFTTQKSISEAFSNMTIGWL